jgi:hypothetical protein
MMLQFNHAPVAHLDRASVYGTEGRVFESLQAHHTQTSHPNYKFFKFNIRKRSSFYEK